MADREPYKNREMICLFLFFLVSSWHLLFAVILLPALVAWCRELRSWRLVALATLALGWTPFWFILMPYALWRERPYPRVNVRTTVKINMKDSDSTVEHNEDGTIKI
jgi:hypothetical protein